MQCLDGLQLVELFNVRFHGGGAPTGTISVFDSKRGQIIYSRSSPNPPRDDLEKEIIQKENIGLPLTGPRRAISGDGCVAIAIDLHGHCHHHDTSSSSTSSSSPPSYVAKVFLDSDTTYDEAITETVETCDGTWADVTYALLSDAVEAIVEVKLLRPRDGGGESICGRIVARTEFTNGTVGEVVLFEEDKGVGSLSLKPTIIIPLARSVLAVPLAGRLTIEVDLHGHSTGDEIVKKASVVCYPDPDTEHVWRRGRNGEVEVKITWSE